MIAHWLRATCKTKKQCFLWGISAGLLVAIVLLLIAVALFVIALRVAIEYPSPLRSIGGLIFS